MSNTPAPTTTTTEPTNGDLTQAEAEKSQPFVLPEEEETPPSSTQFKARFSAEHDEDSSEDDGEVKAEDEGLKPAFTAPDLANWHFEHILEQDDDDDHDHEVDDSTGKQKSHSKLQHFLEHMNDRFDLEHKGWMYYITWYFIVTAVNLALHFVLLLDQDEDNKNKLFLLALNLFITIFSRTVWFKWLIYMPTFITQLMPPNRAKGFINKLAVNNGGIHTCTAYWTVVDAALLTIQSILDGAGGTKRSAAHFFFASVSLMVLFLIVLMALPFREGPVFHEMFEYTHRFGGWFISALFLIDVIISLANGGDDVHDFDDASTWLILASVFLAAYPWLGILKAYNADVYLYAPSKYVVIANWAPRPLWSVPGTAGQLALPGDGVGEYHSFACLGDLNGNPKGCTMGIAKAGDWTTGLIDEAQEIQAKQMEQNPEGGLVPYDNSKPNFKMCYNRIAAPGFMYLLRHYKRVVAIGTGAGIAPIASYLPNPPTEMMILWVGRHFKTTYGPLYDLVDNYHNKIFIDTKLAPSGDNPFSPKTNINFSRQKSNRTVEVRRSSIKFGTLRPDLPQLAMAAVDLFKADAVFIISGKTPTFDVCSKLWKNGIHAYGATWDS